MAVAVREEEQENNIRRFMTSQSALDARRTPVLYSLPRI